METSREKALNYNTLIGILKACEGKNIQIDLRNEMHIYGKCESVFAEMNVTLTDAYLIAPSTSTKPDQKTQSRFYSEISIRGSNIRFVHIPDDVDMISALQKSVLIARNKNKINKNEFKKRPRQNNINK